MIGTVRTEHDTLGSIDVPADAYWGAQTERARRNFPVSGRTMPPRLLAALGAIKAEAALVNGELGVLEATAADAVRRAAEEVAANRLDDHFPVDVFQTGSGTSTNMNANEVIANRANEMLGGSRGANSPVHPNDHVNASQSSNDVIPTALHVAATGAIAEHLRPALERLAGALEARATAFDGIVKVGRTHLQDAVPVRLGQEFSGYAQQCRNGLARLDAAAPGLDELALGGTAVGTGLNAPRGFAERTIARLAARTGYPFVPAPNRFEALAARDAVVEASGTLRTIAVSLTKIANDLRWLASGPRCGIGELRLPALQPGSSIMPGKVNPVVPEAVLMVCARVLGNDVTIGIAGASGSFELNTTLPLLAHVLLESVDLLGSAATLLAARCVDGLEADVDRCRELLERSLAVVTGLVPRIGYERAAAIAKTAFAQGRSIRDVAREASGLPVADVDRLLDARRQTEPDDEGG
jgi:fumarate hydratase class II